LLGGVAQGSVRHGAFLDRRATVGRVGGLGAFYLCVLNIIFRGEKS
jgi:hypothetical protein